MINKIEKLLKTLKKATKDLQFIKDEQPEELTLNKTTGQWSLDKSNYSGYDSVANIKRKANNIEGESDTGIKTMNRVKGWKGPANQKMLDNAVKEHKKNAVAKLWTKEHGWHIKDKKGTITLLDDEDKAA